MHTNRTQLSKQVNKKCIKKGGNCRHFFSLFQRVMTKCQSKTTNHIPCWVGPLSNFNLHAHMHLVHNTVHAHTVSLTNLFNEKFQYIRIESKLDLSLKTTA